MASKLLKLIPTMQSAALVSSMVKKKGKVKFDDPIKSSSKVLIGIPLIKATGSLI